MCAEPIAGHHHLVGCGSNDPSGPDERHALIRQQIKRNLVQTLSARPLRRLGRMAMRHRVPVFALHRPADPRHDIRGEHLDSVRQHLRLLRSLGMRPVSTAEIVERCLAGEPAEPDSVAFTIDDGFADQLQLTEIFEAEGWPVTMFVITNFLDGIEWPWDYRIGWAFDTCEALPQTIHLAGSVLEADADIVRSRIMELDGDRREEWVRTVAEQLGVTVPDVPPPEHAAMTWDEARAAESDLVKFAPHSCSHSVLSSLSEASARQEIERSWDRVRTEFNDPQAIIGWPIGRAGDYSARDGRLAQEAGLAGAFAVRDSYADLAGSRWNLCRFALPDTPEELLQCATWIDRGVQLVRGVPTPALQGEP